MVGGEWKKGNTFKILIALLSMFLLKNGEDDYPKGKFERFNTEWRGQTKRKLFSEERISFEAFADNQLSACLLFSKLSFSAL